MSTTMKEELIRRMKDVFGDDAKRINHALLVLEYAGRIRDCVGGDGDVVAAAAVLHDIGIHQAERKYGSTAGKFQEIEGPPIARPILAQAGLPPDKIDHVCKIIANHHSARDVDTLEFRVLWDADWLVNIPDECADLTRDELKKFIDKTLKTVKGGQLAEEIYLSKD